MAVNAGSVYSELILNAEKYFSTLEKADKEMNTFVGKLQNAGKQMEKAGKDLMLKVTTPIVGATTAATRLGMDFQAVMSEVGALSGATGEEFAALSDKAREMGATTKFSASDAAEALKYMAMSGWETADMLEGIEGILALAAASGESLGLVADIVSDSMTAFGLAASEAGHFADVLAKASSNSNTNVALMGETFKYVAPLAGSLGYSIEDTAHAVGLMANAGIKGSQAGTALRGMLTNLIKPTKESGTAMDMLGISMTNADGTMKSLGEVMDDLRQAFADLEPDQQAFYAAQIAGQQAMSGFLAIVNASDEDFNKLRENIYNATGAAKEMSDIMQDNLKGRWEEFRSAVEEAALQIYDLILPSLENMLAKMQEIVDGFLALDDGTKQTIIQLAALAAAIGPTLFVGGKLTGWIGNTASKLIDLGKYMKDVGGVTGLMGKAFGAITSPAGLMTVAIAGITAAVIYLWNTNEEFREKVAVIWDKVKDIFDTALDFIKQVIEVFVDQATKFWNIFGENIKQIADNAWRFITDIISSALDVIRGLLDVFIGLITGDWEQMSEGLKKIWYGLWEGIKTVVEGAWGLLSGAFSILWSAISEWFISLKNDAINWGKDIVRGLWDGIKSMGSWITGKAKEFGSWVANGFKSILGIASPSKVFAEYGKFTVEGYVKGIEQNKYKAIKSVEDMGKMVVSEYDKLGNAVITALRRKYQEEERLQLDSLRRQTENIRRETDERLRQYDRELKAKLEILDLETSEEEKRIQEQIDAINNKTKEEEKELREQEYQTRLAEKAKELAEAESAEERLKIQKELNDLKAARERELLLEQRQMQIEALRAEMERIRQQAAEKRTALEQEYQEKKQNEENKLNAVITNLENEMEATKQHYATILEEERLQAQARTLILDENNQELIALLESYNPHWQDAGQSFGESLLTGLNSMKQSIQDAVEEILSMVGQADRAAARVHHQNAIIIEAKRDWERAYRAGDNEAMEEAHRRAEEARRKGGTIGYDETLEEALKKVGYNAQGTNYWRGGLTWVGEQGPELIELPRGTKIHSNQKSMEMMREGRQIVQNININSPTPLSPSEIARKNLQVSRQLAMEWGL